MTNENAANERAPPCQFEPAGFIERSLRIVALPPALIGDLGRSEQAHA
jgi:hypothetical protein